MFCVRLLSLQLVCSTETRLPNHCLLLSLSENLYPKLLSVIKRMRLHKVSEKKNMQEQTLFKTKFGEGTGPRVTGAPPWRVPYLGHGGDTEPCLCGITGGESVESQSPGFQVPFLRRKQLVLSRQRKYFIFWGMARKHTWSFIDFLVLRRLSSFFLFISKSLLFKTKM